MRLSNAVLLIFVLTLVCLGTAEATAKQSASHTGKSAAQSTHGKAGNTAVAVHSTHGKASSKGSTSKANTKKVAAKKAHAPRGQAEPDNDRTSEIQTALIREHYLSGEPTGTWDAQTRDALTRYQADHGWQTKMVPDSRALINLGLGPSREGLLNPDTAAVTPHELGADKPQPGGSAN